MKLQLKDTTTPEEVEGKLSELTGEVIYYGRQDSRYYMIANIGNDEYIFLDLLAGTSGGRYRGKQNIPKGYYFARKAELDIER